MSIRSKLISLGLAAMEEGSDDLEAMIGAMMRISSEVTSNISVR
jgi:hypothetical protein